MSLATAMLVKALERDLGRVKPFTDSSTTSHVAAYQLQNEIVRKFTESKTNKLAEINALKKFESVNAKLKEWISVGHAPQESPQVLRILERAKKLFHDQFTDSEGFPKYNLGKAYNIGAVGKGSSVGCFEPNFFGKLFQSQLTATTPMLFRYFEQATNTNPRWKMAALQRRLHVGPGRVVRGNTMFFVPKETEIARVAFTEPTINMFGQLGYSKLIREVLVKSHDIDMSTQQPKNGWFARSGSLNGIYCTIDLSSASDTIGLRLCDFLLPPRLNKDLLALRSHYYRSPNGKWVRMNMMSTMGNGFTSALQTLIFANLILATYLELGLKPVCHEYGRRTYAVFGDDIICKKMVYDRVVDVLTRCGFTVNEKKSFSTGYFRESCGYDYYKGIDVRAVYLHSYNDHADVFGLLNRLMLWSHRHKIALAHTFKYLLSLVNYRPVPLYEDERAGIRTPIKHLRARRISPNGNWTYHCLESIKVSKPVSEVTSGMLCHGAIISNLQGTIRNGRISPRQQASDEEGDSSSSCGTKVVKRESWIHWDYLRDASLTSSEYLSVFEANVLKARLL